MKNQDEKIKKLYKVLIVILATVGLCSALLFVTQIRESVILLGEKYTGRSLNHSIWNSKLIKYEIDFIIFIILCLFFILVKNEKFEKINLKQSIIKIIAWSFIFISSVFLIIIACQSNDIWLDETFSLGLARHNVKDLVSLTAQDVHPPLYYLILKIAVMIFPNSIAAAKIVSVIPVIVLMCTVQLFFSKEYSSVFGFLFNLLLLSIHSVIQYSLDIRMYSWCLLFCTLCCICSYYIIKKGDLKYFLFYVFFAECGAYSQYWTAVGLAINFVLISALCIKKDKRLIKNILIAAMVGIVLYIPWAKVVISQISKVSENYWISPLTIRTFVGYIFSVIPVGGFLKIATVFLMFFFFIKCIKNTNFKTLFFLICFATPFLQIFCATGISLAVRPFFQAKYAFPLIVFELFFIVCSLNEFARSKKNYILLSIVFLFCSFNNLIYNYNFEKATKKEYVVFENLMKENLSEKTVFVFGENVDSHTPRNLAYKFPHNKIYGRKISDLWTSTYFYNPKNLIESLDGQTDICLVLSLDDDTPKDFENIPFYFAKVDGINTKKIFFRNNTKN